LLAKKGHAEPRPHGNRPKEAVWHFALQRAVHAYNAEVRTGAERCPDRRRSKAQQATDPARPREPAQNKSLAHHDGKEASGGAIGASAPRDRTGISTPGGKKAYQASPARRRASIQREANRAPDGRLPRFSASVRRSAHQSGRLALTKMPRLEDPARPQKAAQTQRWAPETSRQFLRSHRRVWQTRVKGQASAENPATHRPHGA
jgi:hypothetical protein